MELSPFTLNTWTFVNTGFLGLLKYIPDTEKQDFDFSFNTINTEDMFKECIIGTQKYLFNTNPEKIEGAIKKLKRLIIKLTINDLFNIYINKFIFFNIFSD